MRWPLHLLSQWSSRGPVKVIAMSDLESAVSSCGDAETPADFGSCLSAELTKRGYEITPAAETAARGHQPK